MRALRNRAGTDFDYTLKTAYYGGHVGAGFVRALDARRSLDFNFKALWTHLEGEKVRIRGTRDHLIVDDVDSSRVRLGARYNHNFGAMTAYASAAWEHEFNGKTKGVYRSANHGDSDIRNASIKGSSGIGRLGADWRLSERATFGAGAYGIVGKRRGFGGDVHLSIGF